MEEDDNDDHEDYDDDTFNLCDSAAISGSNYSKYYSAFT